MDLDLTDEQRLWRARVRSTLDTPAIRAELTALEASGEAEPDVRALYRLLGETGLLAVDWPTAYGGRAGCGAAEAAVVAEELVRAGVPDTLHVNTIQIVGRFLLSTGTHRQRHRWLPGLARGETFACVLYTEPGAGSDLGALQTAAEPVEDGYRLTGVKSFSVKADLADVALCAARTSTGAGRYQGLSLFMVPMDADGVRRSTLDGITDESFHRVELDGVHVGGDTLVGTEGQGWSLLLDALALERTGLDYALRARRWFGAALSGPAPIGPGNDAAVAETGRLGARINAAHWLARRVLEDQEEGGVDGAAAAVAKYCASETAQEVAHWAASVHGSGPHGCLSSDLHAAVDAAYREAPGLTLSAGTSEIMLDIVAAELEAPTGGAASPPPPGADPVLATLRTALRNTLAETVPDDAQEAPGCPARVQTVWEALDGLGVPLYETGTDQEGLDLGLSVGAAVCEELGRAGLPDPYRGHALITDVGGGAETTPAPVSLTGFEALPTGSGLTVRTAPGGTVERDGARVSGTVVTESVGTAPLAVVLAGPERPWVARLPVARSGWSPTTTGTWARVISFERADITPDDIVGPLGPELDRARVRQASYLLGVAEGALEQAVAFTGERRQFGRPIREFQAVGHLLARCTARLALLRAAISLASWCCDTGRPTTTAAVDALLLAAQTVPSVTSHAMHVCGVRALTTGLSVHRHYRLAVLDAARLGAAHHLSFLAGRGRSSGGERA
ncbi:alkylation response protein AidB-like acyl-CoA dehydrogenase [Nocardiopsis sp. Huas11]|uniref:acyl-CoA dehydrogenase family protein n=1 Tax=Nocardiopsis sp. Huas11 TaxID=2183912 RepID=UPI000EB19FEF|nr:acyl-CoA dehydrogenase family protein [Nocardiopsis sp. Huas11]RKS08407.1 alkylation response protein AidB-like acyl-CoA dehydrogenase [Nocardiopsis sp. Huas11]